MTIQIPSVLKTYFEAGDRPTEAQFGDLIDSAVREAMTVISDAIEITGITGLLTVEAGVNVTTTPAQTFGLRVLNMNTTAQLQNMMQSTNQGALAVLATGASDTVVGVSAGNFKCRYVNGQSIQVTGQVSGDLLVALNSVAWTRIPTSSAGTMLVSNGTKQAPNFQPTVFTTTISLAGHASVTVDSIPSWANSIMIVVRDQSGTNTHDVQLGLGNASVFLSAGYVGASLDLGTATRTLSGGFILAVSDAASEVRQSIAQLDWLGGNVWSIHGHADVDCIFHGTVDTSSTMTRLRLLTTTGTFDDGTLYITARR